VQKNPFRQRYEAGSLGVAKVSPPQEGAILKRGALPVNKD